MAAFVALLVATAVIGFLPMWPAWKGSNWVWKLICFVLCLTAVATVFYLHAFAFVLWIIAWFVAAVSYSGRPETAPDIRITRSSQTSSSRSISLLLAAILIAGLVAAWVTGIITPLTY